jgi:hypothetical protein
MKDLKTIRLTDNEVDLSDYKLGDICEIKIKGKITGMEERTEMNDMSMEVGAKKDKKPSKKYIEYSIEVQKAKEESEDKIESPDNFFSEDEKTGKYATKN